MAGAQRVQIHVDPSLISPPAPGRPSSTPRKVTVACADSAGRRRAPAKAPTDPGASAVPGLAALGLRVGEPVRWRQPGAGGWQLGVVTRRERDGSIGITDNRGLARSVAVDRLEVNHTGPRGARTWEPLTSRAARSEQLRLL